MGVFIVENRICGDCRKTYSKFVFVDKFCKAAIVHKLHRGGGGGGNSILSVEQILLGLLVLKTYIHIL